MRRGTPASRCLWTTAGASTCFSKHQRLHRRPSAFRSHTPHHVDVEGGQKILVLIKDIQVDRFRRDVQHIDFWAVDMSKDVTLRADPDDWPTSRCC